MAVVKLVKVVSAIGDNEVFVNPDAIVAVYPRKVGSSDSPTAIIHMVNDHKVRIDEATYGLLSRGLAEVVGTVAAR